MIRMRSQTQSSVMTHCERTPSRILVAMVTCLLAMDWIRGSVAKPLQTNITQRPRQRDNKSSAVSFTTHNYTTLESREGPRVTGVTEVMSSLFITKPLEDDTENSTNKDKVKVKLSKKQRLQLRRKERARSKKGRKKLSNSQSENKNSHSKTVRVIPERDLLKSKPSSKPSNFLEQDKSVSFTQEIYNKSMSNGIYTKILELESHLLKEMVRNRDLYNTLMKHSQWLTNMNRTVFDNEQDFSLLESHVENLGKQINTENEYRHSIDNKLASVMLDVAEVNNLLSTQEERKNVKLEDKRIVVQSPSQQKTCATTANTTQYRDCEELYHNGHTQSGVYYITPLYTSCSIPVYCDMDTPPGGWLVFQRRQDGSTNFHKDWRKYRLGFGDVTNEFWLGNDNLFLLTNQGHYQLRIDLWDFYGSRVYADYIHFKVDGERDRYKLHVSNHSGTAPDGLKNHNGMYFSTPDRDNDHYQEYHCAKEWSAGWWFSNCWFAILNGQYYNNTQVEYRGISWNDWKTEQLKKVEMKIRPSGF